ncbi:uncharacterized protein LOC107607659 [Arachis ipaensis]|uniref:uncharacterized protein LOC107607659 n=1 Tax=Arachis ipaensis TaxID=130454 RepID=UPI0007AF7A9C|nr:uncharacterized protein LOC107607659 [Arachis ipaensis]XP_025665125.1 uncharacterized protein LOC112763748 [Arachis hypogaea]
MCSRFAAARIYVHGSDYLGTICQGPQESLEDYMTRFAEATIEIPDLDPAVHLHALKAGLPPSKFRETIAVTKRKTLEEFEKGRQDRWKLRSSVKPKEQKENNLEGRKTERQARAGSYQDQRFVDKSKHCAFHQKYGHTTDECVIAKDLLERLTRQGLLDKYIKGRKHKESSRDREKCHQTLGNKEDNKWSNNTPPKGIINYISGGFTGGGETTSVRKRSYRAMLAIEGAAPQSNKDALDLKITFSQTDICSAAPNLDDPVVISIQTGELLVRKVLLDLGSSADVLFYSTFLKMKLSKKLIQPSSGELVGFSGERVPIKGYIWLKTTMGEDSLSRTIDRQYLIVDCPSPYNIILGRPALNMFRAVVSTFHLCVKFQARDGRIATLHSDRQHARQCYNASLKRSDVRRESQQEVKAIHSTNEVLSLAELDPRGDT